MARLTLWRDGEIEGEIDVGGAQDADTSGAGGLLLEDGGWDAAQGDPSGYFRTIAYGAPASASTSGSSIPSRATSWRSPTGRAEKASVAATRPDERLLDRSSRCPCSTSGRRIASSSPAGATGVGRLRLGGAAQSLARRRGARDSARADGRRGRRRAGGVPRVRAVHRGRGGDRDRERDVPAHPGRARLPPRRDRGDPARRRARGAPARGGRPHRAAARPRPAHARERHVPAQRRPVSRSSMSATRSRRRSTTTSTGASSSSSPATRRSTPRRFAIRAGGRRACCRPPSSSRRSSVSADTQSTIDERNRAFWDELCGTGLAHARHHRDHARLARAVRRGVHGVLPVPHALSRRAAGRGPGGARDRPRFWHRRPDPAQHAAPATTARTSPRDRSR